MGHLSSEKIVCPKCFKYKHKTRHHILPKRKFGTTHNSPTVDLCWSCHCALEEMLCTKERHGSISEDTPIQYLIITFNYLGYVDKDLFLQCMHYLFGLQLGEIFLFLLVRRWEQHQQGLYTVFLFSFFYQQALLCLLFVYKKHLGIISEVHSYVYRSLSHEFM